MSFMRREGDDLLIAVRLSPRARRESIGTIWRDAHEQSWLQASVTAPPDKGRANAALIKMLGKRFKVAQTSILLETGETNRLKRLRITDCAPAVETLLMDLASEEQT